MKNQLSKNYVPPEGKLSAKLMLVGEAPGYWEDKEGRPFVGRSGRLLDKILRDIGTAREFVWITNVVKYRPPANRTPTWEEINEGRKELFKEIKLLEPKAIVALGLTAIRALLGREVDSMTNMRKKIIRVNGIRVFPTYHPAAALRMPRLEQYIRTDLERGEQWSQLKKGRMSSTQSQDTD